MSALKIGFVGLGDQGAPIAEAISEAGFELHVWARRAAIIVSSGSSAILQSIGGQISSEAALHIQALMRKDIEHFAEAMRARGLDPSSVRDRGLGGADGVVALAQWIEAGKSLAQCGARHR